MLVVKYLLLIVTLTLPLLSDEWLKDFPITLKALRLKRKGMPLNRSPKYVRRVKLVLLIISVTATIALSIFGDVSNHKAQKKLDGQIASQNAQMSEQSQKLDTQKAMLADQKRQLDNQNRLLHEQAKSIGSVLYNTDTSLAGKERFLRGIDVLARIASVDADNTGFTGLICKDGVAVYWFDVDTETITGFHFFANAEVNRVLGGAPIGDGFIGADGVVSLDANAELAVAFRDCLFRRIPPLPENEIEAGIVRDQVLSEIKTIFKYVYRGEDVKTDPIYPSKKNAAPSARKHLGDYVINFKYAVDPFAEQKTYIATGVFDFTLSKEFLDSLHGLTVAELSERVIEKFRAGLLEPKISVGDIKRIAEDDHFRTQAETFPFASR